MEGIMNTTRNYPSLRLSFANDTWPRTLPGRGATFLYPHRWQRNLLYLHSRQRNGRPIRRPEREALTGVSGGGDTASPCAVQSGIASRTPGSYYGLTP